MAVPDLLVVAYRRNDVAEDRVVTDQRLEQVHSRHAGRVILGNALLVRVYNGIDDRVNQFRENTVIFPGDERQTLAGKRYSSHDIGSIIKFFDGRCRTFHDAGGVNFADTSPKRFHDLQSSIQNHQSFLRKESGQDFILCGAVLDANLQVDAPVG